MSKSATIRSGSDIVDRLSAARCEFEGDEYTRMIGAGAETWKDIDHGAKQTLGVLARHVTRQSKWAVRVIAQYVAWKWLLGHPDADTFHGAHGKPHGYDPRTTYIILRNQIESGEWDRFTRTAIRRRKRERTLTVL